MEKIKLNNQIVHMRKHVKQAKVHSINRLVKQLKLLENRKGNESKVKKAERKAERYRQEVSLLKKMKPDYISKLALSKAKNWKKILLQKNSTLEDRCIAILASYEPVQKEVELFHNSNKDIVSKIPDFFKQWEEKSKFNENSREKKNPNFIKLKNNANLLKTSIAGGISNCMKSQPESTENSPYLKNKKRKKEDLQKQTLNTSIKSSLNSSLDESICEKSHDNEDLVENNLSHETENKPVILLCSDSKNKSEHHIYSNLNETAEVDCESNDESEIENESDMEKINQSESEDSEGENVIEKEFKTDDTKIKDKSIKKVIKSTDSEYYKGDAIHKKCSDAESVATCSVSFIKDITGSKPNENKLKAVAVINLDDYKDLDEIPVSNFIGNAESSEEEDNTTDNESLNTVPQSDSFFLGRDEAVSAENKLIYDLKGNSFGSRNEIFEKREKSNNHHNYENNSHKPLKSSRFFNKHAEFKTEKNVFKSCNKDKSRQKHYEDRLEKNNRHSFNSGDPRYKYEPYKYKNIDRNDFKNKKQFYQKADLQTHGYKQKYSNDLDRRNSDNVLKNNKEPHNKNDSSSKPLHPSWEAKRKQKEMVTASFQGKKIVFEN